MVVITSDKSQFKQRFVMMMMMKKRVFLAVMIFLKFGCIFMDAGQINAPLKKTCSR